MDDPRRKSASDGESHAAGETLREGYLDFKPEAGSVQARHQPSRARKLLKGAHDADHSVQVPASPWEDATSADAGDITVGRLPSGAMEALSIAEERGQPRTVGDPDMAVSDGSRVNMNTPPLRCSAEDWRRPPMTGSTLADPNQRLQRVMQRSVVMLRLRLGHRIPGTEHSPHQMELRLMCSYNGKDIGRYSIFVDEDTFVGFPGGNRRARFSLTLRERFIVPSAMTRVAQVHFVLTGHVATAEGTTIRFECACVLKGDGVLTFSQPKFDGPSGRALFGSSSLTLGIW